MSKEYIEGLREAIEIAYSVSSAWDDTTRMITHAIQVRIAELEKTTP